MGDSEYAESLGGFGDRNSPTKADRIRRQPTVVPSVPSRTSAFTVVVPGKPELPECGNDGRTRVVFGRSYGMTFRPSKFIPSSVSHEPPSMSLNLRYVYGYNGSNVSSIHFCEEKTLVYPVACVGIVHRLSDNTQKFFIGHSAEITCLAFSPKNGLCASGQRDPRGPGGPYVCVWVPTRPEDGPIAILDGHEKAVDAVAFSGDGATIVSVGGDDDHTICVWRNFDLTVRNSPAVGSTIRPVYIVSGGRTPVRSLAAAPGSLSFLVVAQGQFRYWTIADDFKSINVRNGVFGVKNDSCRNPQHSCMSLTHEGISIISGDDGNLYVASRNTVQSSTSICSKPGSVGCAAFLSDTQLIACTTTGSLAMCKMEGSKPVTVVWQMPLVSMSGDGAQQLISMGCSNVNISSIATWKGSSKVTLGTKSHMIIIVDVARKECSQVLQVSHSGEAWALAHHPKHALAASGSSIGNVRFWNIGQNVPLTSKVVRCDYGVYSLKFSGDGSLLVIGQDEGIISILDFPTLNVIYNKRVSSAKERIADIAIHSGSQNLSLIAAACWDQNVYLFRVKPSSNTNGAVEIHLAGSLSGNSSSPVSVVFSKDGQFVMSNSKDCQILVWRTSDGQRMASSHMFRDTLWQSNWGCIMGWPVIGIWGDPNYDQTNIKSVHQSSGKNGSFLALGDDFGNVKLFRFPTPFLAPGYRVYACRHFGPVTRVAFSPSNVLLTLGGQDHAVMQWELVDERRDKEENSLRPPRVL